MHIARGRKAEGQSEQRGPTFTGTVWADPVMSTDDGTVVNNVFFEPGARTHWHFHERGQILNVTSGFGLICSHGERPQVLRTGDVVWVPAGERHWHGGNLNCCMQHLAVSFGKTTWLEPVTDDEYRQDPVGLSPDEMYER